jgi:hypothetical protein
MAREVQAMLLWGERMSRRRTGTPTSGIAGSFVFETLVGEQASDMPIRIE